MHTGNHALTRDFPELKERIQGLRQSDQHFSRLNDEYNAVDVEVARGETGEQNLSDEHMESLKKQRALLKDKLYAMLKETA
ncbi:MAG: GTP-binding protein [Moraxellaceae bacterium]|jgi:uncharacterized protein YdcH (DUF465 family)|nr:GTP-binding protein [Moraxellaceae bacterium]